MTDQGGHLGRGDAGPVEGHEVRATYRSLHEARSALVALERHGVEAAHIELDGPGAAWAELPITNDEQGHADLAIERRLERRGGLGFVLGAVVGGLVVAGLAHLLSDSDSAWIGGMIAGAIFGGGLGFLWSGFAGLAVNEGFADTYAAPADVDAPTIVVVHDEDPDAVVQTLRGTNPSSLMVA